MCMCTDMRVFVYDNNNWHRYVAKFLRKSDRVLPNPDVKYTNLYVKNLDLNVRDELLKEKFSEFGKIVGFAIARDENGISRGFGFVNFESPDDARRALESMNGTQFGRLCIFLGPWLELWMQSFD